MASTSPLEVVCCHDDSDVLAVTGHGLRPFFQGQVDYLAQPVLGFLQLPLSIHDVILASLARLWSAEGERITC